MDKKKIEEAVRTILEAVGDDPARGGLKDTPARVARMYEEILRGNSQSAAEILKPLDSEKHDEIVLIKDIPLYSMCEHHLLPFFGRCHIRAWLYLVVLRPAALANRHGGGGATDRAVDRNDRRHDVPG